MELGIKLFFIEESRNGIQKRYNDLKREVKNNGNITQMATNKEPLVMPKVCLKMPIRIF